MKIHDIDRIKLPQTFSFSLPSPKIPDDHSVLIDELARAEEYGFVSKE